MYLQTQGFTKIHLEKCDKIWFNYARSKFPDFSLTVGTLQIVDGARMALDGMTLQCWDHYDY